MEVVNISFRRTRLGILDQQELVENVIVLRSWTITLYGLLFELILTVYSLIWMNRNTGVKMQKFNVLQQSCKIKRYTNTLS